MVSLPPRVLYTKQYFDSSDADPSLKSRDIDYINVPLTLRYHADGLFFEAGPEANFAIKAVNEAGADVKSNDVTPVTLNYVVGLATSCPWACRPTSATMAVSAEPTNPRLPTTWDDGSLRASTFWFGLGYAFGGSK